MSHPEQLAFFAAVAAANVSLVVGASVLEIGSYDVNGSIRKLFGSADQYIGVDLCEGPSVDVVSYGHELDYPAASFDITLSGECFEHDPHWRQTFLNMVRMTRPGGLVAFSCASRGRLEHGTARTDPASSPGTRSVGSDYYRNLGEHDFDDLAIDTLFQSHKFWYLPGHCDLLFVGIIAGEDLGANLPANEVLTHLNALMSRPYKLITLPFRGLSRILSDSAYQSLALPLSKLFRPAVAYFEKRRNTL